MLTAPGGTSVMFSGTSATKESGGVEVYLMAAVTLLSCKLCLPLCCTTTIAALPADLHHGLPHSLTPGCQCPPTQQSQRAYIALTG